MISCTVRIYIIYYTVWHVYIEWYRLQYIYTSEWCISETWFARRMAESDSPTLAPQQGDGEKLLFEWLRLQRMICWIDMQICTWYVQLYAAICKYWMFMNHPCSYWFILYVIHIYVIYMSICFDMPCNFCCTWYCTHCWNHKWLNAGGLDLIISARHCAASLPTRESRRSTKVTFVHLSSFHHASVLQNPSFISKIIFQLSSNIIHHP